MEIFALYINLIKSSLIHAKKNKKNNNNKGNYNISSVNNSITANIGLIFLRSDSKDIYNVIKYFYFK